MKTKVYSWKRQSGKTTNLVHSFLQHPDESVIITYSINGVRDLLRRFDSLNKYKKRIRASSQNLRGWNIKYLYIDEYFIMKNNDIESILDDISFVINHNDGEVHIYTSTEMFLDEVDYVIFDMVKSLRKFSKWFTDDWNDFLDNLDDDIGKKARFFYKSILTSPDTKFIQHAKLDLNEELALRYGEAWKKTENQVKMGKVMIEGL